MNRIVSLGARRGHDGTNPRLIVSTGYVIAALLTLVREGGYSIVEYSPEVLDNGMISVWTRQVVNPTSTYLCGFPPIRKPKIRIVHVNLFRRH